MWRYRPGRRRRTRRREAPRRQGASAEGASLVATRAVVAPYEPVKDGDIVATKLTAFRGTLTADAEHRFNDVFASGDVLEAGCNAHGRRKFRDAEATQPALAVEGGALLGAIYGEEEKAHTLGLEGNALREHRQQFIRPIAQNFERWLDAVEPTLLPSEPLAAAIGYYQRHKAALFRFIDDPRVPIDNSPTERVFQNVAKLRLNMLFAGSTEGALGPSNDSARIATSSG